MAFSACLSSDFGVCMRFHGVRTALTACRQNRRSEVSVICAFAQAIFYEIVHAQTPGCLKQWPDQMHPKHFSPPSSASLQSYADSSISSLDVVGLHMGDWQMREKNVIPLAFVISR